MNQVKLFKIIVEIISIIAITNANLITIDGQCPFSGLSPSQIAVVPVIKGKFNIIAETSSGPINRTDFQMLFQQTSKDSFLATKRFRSTEDDQCYDIKINGKATEQNGVYDATYQVAPDTEAVGFTGYFLILDPATLYAAGFICHDLPDGKYHVDIAVLSGVTNKYDQSMQERTKKLFQEQNIENLYEYMVEIENNNKCEFSSQETIQAFIPPREALIPDFGSYLSNKS